VTVTDVDTAGLVPVVVNVTTPVRAADVVLDEAVRVRVALTPVAEMRPKPVCGATVSQDALEEAFHAVLEGAIRVCDPPAGVKVKVDTAVEDVLVTFTTGVLAVGA